MHKRQPARDADRLAHGHAGRLDPQRGLGKAVAADAAAGAEDIPRPLRDQGTERNGRNNTVLDLPYGVFSVEQGQLSVLNGNAGRPSLL